MSDPDLEEIHWVNSYQKVKMDLHSRMTTSLLNHLFSCSRVIPDLKFSLSNIEGVETSTTALTYVIYALGRSPELQAEVAEELSDYSDVESLDPSGLEKLPLLNSVIRESMRYWPPAPAPFARLSPPEGVTVGGYYIPGGVRPSLNQRLIIRFKCPVRLIRPVVILKSSMTQIRSTRDGLLPTTHIY